MLLTLPLSMPQTLASLRPVIGTGSFCDRFPQCVMDHYIDTPPLGFLDLLSWEVNVMAAVPAKMQALPRVDTCFSMIVIVV